jgi:ATP-binding cassette, subfamily C (CFTR/MRP), member 1
MNNNSNILPSAGCSSFADDAFGPIVEQECRDGFDFTLTFEQYIFSLLPASLLLIVVPFRLAYLSSRKKRGMAPVVGGRALKLAKLAAISVFAVLQLTLMILWATQQRNSRLKTASVAASSVSFASTLMFSVLSYAEHARSLRPSAILNVYLLVSLLLDAATLRTLWLGSSGIGGGYSNGGLIDSGLPIRAVFSASFALKAAILVLEAKNKTKYIAERGGDSGREAAHNPEEASGIYSQGFFWWLTPLLVTGFKRLLKPLDLFVLDESMSAALLNERFWRHWNQGGYQCDI